MADTKAAPAASKPADKPAEKETKTEETLNDKFNALWVEVNDQVHDEDPRKQRILNSLTGLQLAVKASVDEASSFEK
jgi:hypothetical protein